MCVAFRNYSAVVDSRVQQIVRDMSATPVVWHGNGDGKLVYEIMLKKFLNCDSGKVPPGVVR